MPKSSVVVNVHNGKPKNLIRWERKANGELSWKYIKTPKAIGSRANAELIQSFYMAVGVPAYIYDMNQKRFVG